MFKKLTLAVLLTLLTASATLAANLMSPAELKDLLEQQQPVILVDIQPAADFEKQHLPGSIETNAFPAKTVEEKQRLDQTLPVIEASNAPVAVLCPRGKSGAQNSYDYLITKGVPEERMRILEGGIAGWPYPDLFAAGE
ncbi:MAG: rhodanese-like domain-containing protein [Trichloromonas sp.]|jgi:rhodanese-related sulfurtransferase|nr:rhodanese-like domain-containing protein [Trichloromonas sp.]